MKFDPLLSHTGQDTLPQPDWQPFSGGINLVYEEINPGADMSPVPAISLAVSARFPQEISVDLKKKEKNLPLKLIPL